MEKKVSEVVNEKLAKIVPRQQQIRNELERIID